MGICSSCLGFDRRRSQEDDAETRGLLSDDPYRGPHYGTDGAIPPHQRAQYQEDPESVRHRREALEGICYTMSDNVIDVFTAQQPQVSGPYGPNVSESRMGDITQNSDEPPRADLSLKTIKKGKVGSVFSHRGPGISGFKAVQDAIG